MPARVLAQRIEMDRLDQGGEIAFGGLPAHLLQHQPADFLHAGDALAVGDLAPDFQRAQDDGMRGGGKAGAAEQRLQGDIVPAGQQRPHPLFGLLAERDQRRAEEIDLAMRDGADEEAGGQIAAQAQMLDQRGMFFLARAFDQRHRGLDASVAHDALGPCGAHQCHDQRRCLQVSRRA